MKLRLKISMSLESDPTFVQILAEGPTTSLRLSNKDGTMQPVKP
jgi:hypothetical protein